MENLEELYLSHNGIQKLENLNHNRRLRVIDLGTNFIEKLQGLEELEELEELWANHNRLASFPDVELQMAGKRKLTTVYFEGNPLEVDNRPTYRNKIRLLLPGIQQIDATFVR